MARKPTTNQIPSPPRLRLVGHTESSTASGDLVDRIPSSRNDSTDEPLALIDSMSRRIDVLARDLNLRSNHPSDEGEPRPRAA